MHLLALDDVSPLRGVFSLRRASLLHTASPPRDVFPLRSFQEC